MPTPVVLVSLSENKIATVFSCVGSSRVGDPPWMENLGSIAAIVLPYDATLCSGFAPCGQGPPGCFAARISLIGPRGDAAATLVFIGGLARCESSPCFQPLWMRLSAAMLAAVVDGFSELVDDGTMDLAAIVGDTLCSGFAPRGQGPPGCYAARMSLFGPSGDAAATLVLTGGLARCGPSPCFQSLWMRLSAAMPAAVVKESSNCRPEQQLQQRNKKFLGDSEKFLG